RPRRCVWRAASAPSAEIVSKIPKRALGGGTCSMSIVLHHEPCRAIVQVDDAGNRILGRRAVNDRRPRRGVEDVQIVGGLLLARGHTAVHVEAAVKQVRCCRDGMPRLNKALPYMRA